MKRTWVDGQTMGMFRFRRVVDGKVKYEMFYFVDDRGGGRRAATRFEAALWRRYIGRVPRGPNGPEMPKVKKKAKKTK